MALTMRTDNFTGENRIQVLDFLRRFVREATVLGMTEAQAYVALPYFLKGTALQQYEAVSDAYAGEEGGVCSWPEAAQYLLRSYATPNAVREAILALRDVRQSAGETEEAYGARLNVAEQR